MLRIGVTPVPVAIMSAGDSHDGPDRVKKPCGPTNRITAPGLIACKRVDPGPPCTCVTAISNRGDPSGDDAIEYDRFTSTRRADRRDGRGGVDGRRVEPAAASKRAHPLPWNERHRLPVHTLEHELADARRERSRPGEAGIEGRGQVGHRLSI